MVNSIRNQELSSPNTSSEKGVPWPQNVSSQQGDNKGSFQELQD